MRAEITPDNDQGTPVWIVEIDGLLNGKQGVISLIFLDAEEAEVQKALAERAVSAVAKEGE